MRYDSDREARDKRATPAAAGWRTSEKTKSCPYPGSPTRGSGAKGNVVELRWLRRSQDCRDPKYGDVQNSNLGYWRYGAAPSQAYISALAIRRNFSRR
jgi:hypothetical protein